MTSVPEVVGVVRLEHQHPESSRAHYFYKKYFCLPLSSFIFSFEKMVRFSGNVWP